MLSWIECHLKEKGAWTVLDHTGEVLGHGKGRGSDAMDRGRHRIDRYDLGRV